MNGEPIGSLSSIEKVPVSRFVLAYSSVKLNVPFSFDQFPMPAREGLIADDPTPLLIKRLDDAIRIEVKRKKDEAEAQGEERCKAPRFEIEIPHEVNQPL